MPVPVNVMLGAFLGSLNVSDRLVCFGPHTFVSLPRIESLPVMWPVTSTSVD